MVGIVAVWSSSSLPIRDSGVHAVTFSNSSVYDNLLDTGSEQHLYPADAASNIRGYGINESPVLMQFDRPSDVCMCIWSIITNAHAVWSRCAVWSPPPEVGLPVDAQPEGLVLLSWLKGAPEALRDSLLDALL